MFHNSDCLSSTIGNGLFLGSGRSLARAGPGGAVMCYMLMGTVISSVISCLGEMTALMPVNAPVMEFPRRFLDRGVGFAVGWMYWWVLSLLACSRYANSVTGLLMLWSLPKKLLLCQILWTFAMMMDERSWVGRSDRTLTPLSGLRCSSHWSLSSICFQ